MAFLLCAVNVALIWGILSPSGLFYGCSSFFPLLHASATGAEDPGFESPLRRDFFSGSSHTSDFKIGTPVQWLHCQVPDIIDSAMGLVGPVSEYCDWVR